jgi:hypothetical protein
VNQKSESDPPALAKLKSAFKGRPILFCELPSELAFALGSEPHRLARFTHTWHRHDSARSKLPTLVVMEIAPDPTQPYSRNAGTKPGCFLARIERSGKVASFQTRLKFVGTHPLGFENFEDLVGAMTKSSFASQMAEGLRAQGSFATFGSIQNDLIQFLWKHHRPAFEKLARPLPGAAEIPEAERQQEDAIKLARTFFGLRSMSDTPEDIHVQEMHAIGRDAAAVPGFKLIAPTIKGTFTFRKDDEELTIYNAHQGPIEEVLGVDLVYVNHTRGSVVMVQYKVLEMDGVDKNWIFRPNSQFHDELSRMRLPKSNHEPDDYRLHPDPFYFKFVRRKQRATSEDTSLVLSLEHVKHVLLSGEHKGKRGGVRFSYEALRGQYLRTTDFIGLVRSGYIGTHRIDSDWLTALLVQISADKRGLVLAVQRRTT